MKSIFIIFLFTFVTNMYSNPTQTAPKKNTISYVISKIENDSIPLLKIQAEIVTEKKGKTKLYYPNNYWGEENLHDCLINLTATGDSEALQITRKNDTITVSHPKKLKSITIEYVIRQDKGDSYDIRYRYRPVIQKSYFHILSPHLFIRPAIAEEEIVTVSIFWKNFPKNHTIHNSFSSNQRSQTIENISLNTFNNGVFVGGDYRIHELNNQGTITLATRGKWIPFDEKAIVSLLSKTFEVQYQFWKDHNENYYTVVLSPITMSGSGSSNSGTGLSNSFDANCTNNEYTTFEQLVSLFNHELNHNWIGTKIKNDNEEEQYWFSEGFTSYYTPKLIAKNHINQYNGTYFIKEINKTIKEHYSSTAKNIPNSAITYESFWNDPDIEKIPYDRGALFAFYLDQKIRKESTGKYSLDDVMQHFLKDAKESNQKITHPYFIKTVNQYLKNDVAIDFKRFIEQGELIPLKEFFETFHLEYDEKIIKLTKMGFKVDRYKRITVIKPDSDALKAGFKIGDQITNFQKDPKPGELATYEILRNGEKKMITLIRGKKELDIPQLKVNDKNILNLNL